MVEKWLQSKNNPYMARKVPVRKPFNPYLSPIRVKQRIPQRVMTRPFGNNKAYYGKPVQLFKDSDRDGVMNVFDCQPRNKKKQDVISPFSGSNPMLEMHYRQESNRQNQQYQNQLRELQRLDELKLDELSKYNLANYNLNGEKTLTQGDIIDSVWNSMTQFMGNTGYIEENGVIKLVNVNDPKFIAQEKAKIASNITSATFVPIEADLLGNKTLVETSGTRSGTSPRFGITGNVVLGSSGTSSSGTSSGTGVVRSVVNAGSSLPSSGVGTALGNVGSTAYNLGGNIATAGKAVASNKLFAPGIKAAVKVGSNIVSRAFGGKK